MPFIPRRRRLLAAFAPSGTGAPSPASSPTRPFPEPRPDILPEILARLGKAEPGREDLRLWSLVLEARGLDFDYRRDERTRSHEIRVPASQAEQAVADVLQFVAENPPWPRTPPAPPTPLATPGTLLAVLGLVLWHGLTIGAFGAWTGLVALPGTHQEWVAQGGADAWRMLHQQEWGRAVTALTLHADGAHLGGNACLGGLLLALAARGMGLGTALFLAVASGTLGNVANAVFHQVQQGAHLSIGASTAVFGLMAALVTRDTRWLLRREPPSRTAQAWLRAWGPLAVGVFLLGFLGTGGGDAAGRSDKVDVLAHLFGFLAGAGLGGWWQGRECRLGERARRLGRWLGWGSLALVVAAWGIALR